MKVNPWVPTPTRADLMEEYPINPRSLDYRFFLHKHLALEQSYLVLTVYEMVWCPSPHKNVSSLDCRGLAYLTHNYDFTACKFQRLAHSRPSSVYWINGLRMNCQEL